MYGENTTSATIPYDIHLIHLCTFTAQCINISWLILASKYSASTRQPAPPTHIVKNLECEAWTLASLHGWALVFSIQFTHAHSIYNAQHIYHCTHTCTLSYRTLYTCSYIHGTIHKPKLTHSNFEGQSILQAQGNSQHPHACAHTNTHTAVVQHKLLSWADLWVDPNVILTKHTHTHSSFSDIVIHIVSHFILLQLGKGRQNVMSPSLCDCWYTYIIYMYMRYMSTCVLCFCFKSTVAFWAVRFTPSTVQLVITGKEV